MMKEAISQAAGRLIAEHRDLFDKMQDVAGRLNRLHDYIFADKASDELSAEDRLFVAEAKARKACRERLRLQSVSAQERRRQEEAERFLAAIEADGAFVPATPGADVFRRQVVNLVGERSQPLATRRAPVLVVTPWFVMLVMVERSIRMSSPGVPVHKGLAQTVRQYLARRGWEDGDACHRAFAKYLELTAGPTAC